MAHRNALNTVQPLPGRCSKTQQVTQALSCTLVNNGQQRGLTYLRYTSFARFMLKVTPTKTCLSTSGTFSSALGRSKEMSVAVEGTDERPLIRETPAVYSASSTSTKAAVCTDPLMRWLHC